MKNVTKKVSCASRLQQLREEMGVDHLYDAYDKEDHKEPTLLSTNVPKVIIKTIKDEQKIIIKHNKKKARKEDIPVDDNLEDVRWLLFEYCNEYGRESIIKLYPDRDELIAFCKKTAVKVRESLAQTTQVSTYNDTQTPQNHVWKYDIPEHLLKEFKKYCKKHPLSSTLTIITRRLQFMRSRNKSQGAVKKLNRLELAALDPDIMRKNLRQVVKNNKLQVEEFQEMVMGLVKGVGDEPELVSKFKAHTKRVQAKLKEQIKDLENNSTRVEFYV